MHVVEGSVRFHSSCKIARLLRLNLQTLVMNEWDERSSLRFGQGENTVVKTLPKTDRLSLWLLNVWDPYSIFHR